MNFNEQNPQPYDWDNEGVYVIENDDYVEGGEDGTSNRQAKELTKRTRNLHKRITTAEGEIDVLQDEIPVKVEAALRTAKEYSDTKDSAVRRDMVTADSATLVTAKQYADTIVAALVDNSPEALNTLQELAVAMGNDPNFATTVMQAVGERAKSSDVNAALAGKANTNHGHSDLAKGTDVNAALAGKAKKNGSGEEDFAAKDLLISNTSAIKDIVFNRNILRLGWASRGDFFELGTPGFGVQKTLTGYTTGGLIWDGQDVYHTGNLNPFQSDIGRWGDDSSRYRYTGAILDNRLNGGMYVSFAPQQHDSTSSMYFHVQGYGDNELYWNNSIDGNRWNGAEKRIFHSGNLGPATTTANGLMSAGDKTKLDKMSSGLLAGYDVSHDGGIKHRFGASVQPTYGIQYLGNGKYEIPHAIGHTEYNVIPVVTGTDDNSTNIIREISALRTMYKCVIRITDLNNNGVQTSFSVTIFGKNG